MKLPAIQGVIDRRILVNFHVDPTVVSRLLPPPFRPKLAAGRAMAGICLIRLKNVRPAFLPVPGGIGSENAAHRFAVEWDHYGQQHQGVFIPRRDSSSHVNALLGGRLIPGMHHHARFDVAETPDRLSVAFVSDDDNTSVKVIARVATDLPATSVFASLAEASSFFEAGSIGYSPTDDPTRCEGLELKCQTWAVQPLTVETVQSSYFDDVAQFPIDSAVFDCALLMRNVAHEWRSLADLRCGTLNEGARA